MKRWTNKEVEILKEEYSKKDGKKRTDLSIKLSELLGRSPSAIRNKAYELGITHHERFYTEEEIIFLKENYDKVSMNDMAEILKKNESNINRKMKELGLLKTKRIHNTINPKKQHIYTKEEKEKISRRAKKWISEKGHPKGFEGCHHSKKSKEKIKNASVEYWKNVSKKELETRRKKQINTRILNGTLNPLKYQTNPFSRTKSGKRKDLNNVFFRSCWEANIARLFNYMHIEWQFEPKTFLFDTIKKGCISYLPDFYLPKEDKWIEVKGWMDPKSKTKLKRFKKYYPKEYEKLILIDEKIYRKISKDYSGIIKNWE